MTKVTVLGGAGEMGRYAVQTLATDAAFSQVIVTDMNLQAAQELATRIGGNMSARGVDAGDEKSLDDVLGDSDAVVNWPSYPKEFAPQAHRVPSVLIADVW